MGHYPTIASCLLQTKLPRTETCPVAGRTWIYPKVLLITTQTPALPVVPANPGISRAHWGLPAPLCRVWHHGLPSSSQSRDRPCWFPCRRNRLVLYHATPCHAIASSRAGQSWRRAGIANGTPGSRNRDSRGLGQPQCAAWPCCLPLQCEGSWQVLTLLLHLLGPKGQFFRLPCSRDRHG